MFVSFYSGNWIHQELVFLSKMSLKAERVSIYKSFIEVDFVAKKRKIVTYNDQVLESSSPSVNDSANCIPEK